MTLDHNSQCDVSNEQVDVLRRAAVVDDASTQAKRTVDRGTGQESVAAQLDDFKELFVEPVQLLLVISQGVLGAAVGRGGHRWIHRR